MIPHRPPPDVPLHLLDGAERRALADHPGGDAWAKACRDAALEAIQSPDATLLRNFGLSAAAMRKGRKLGERSLGDDSVGREALTALAKRLRQD